MFWTPGSGEWLGRSLHGDVDMEDKKQAPVKRRRRKTPLPFVCHARLF